MIARSQNLRMSREDKRAIISSAVDLFGEIIQIQWKHVSVSRISSLSTMVTAN
jgi:predicted HTH domain antitoxin